MFKDIPKLVPFRASWPHATPPHPTLHSVITSYLLQRSPQRSAAPTSRYSQLNPLLTGLAYRYSPIHTSESSSRTSESSSAHTSESSSRTSESSSAHTSESSSHPTPPSFLPTTHPLTQKSKHPGLRPTHPYTALRPLAASRSLKRAAPAYDAPPDVRTPSRPALPAQALDRRRPSIPLPPR
ncbi:hypothetical protein PLICRDRAFT_177573 [Plicaturopsis crispa FD-325 SS-3]|nr:hypothetical protein PLICRDRAFT_177573 [Plicaturopsis crispa FD-325 SS-3]